MRDSPHGNCGDRMLEDQLLLIIGLKNDRIFVERANSAGQLYAAHQINGDTAPFLTRRVKESVLNVLRCRLSLHFADLLRFVNLQP